MFRPVLGAALAAALVTGVPAPPVAAEVARVIANSSARFVKPPGSGTAKRITVTIAPRDNPAVLPPPEKPAPVERTAATVAPKQPAGAATGRYAWYWDVIAPGFDGAGPGRLEPALAGLRQGPAGGTVAAPRLQALQDMARAHGAHILRESVGTDVSPALALAVMAVESGGRADAVSSAGAQGLMQLMPGTARRFGVSDSFDPAQSIAGGVAFLDFLMKKFDGDPLFVIAGYNAGENSIAPNAGVPPYAETRDYVPKVLAAFEVAKGLCRTPPMFLSDGCVFHGMN
ncbi:lytic murein transglycosylase [Roseivivax isoporae LMG 25204]|uniref:Lytic murein transglycosylase n=1 Tax=Roseivivax isoporae LMG 25204 TaxID=1449351 RepID=X7FDT4_9RHOB|nr:lytic murein transglycosylase [Roseivivax isoporae LMG 25204]